VRVRPSRSPARSASAEQDAGLGVGQETFAQALLLGALGTGGAQVGQAMEDGNVGDSEHQAVTIKGASRSNGDPDPLSPASPAGQQAAACCPVMTSDTAPPLSSMSLEPVGRLLAGHGTDGSRSRPATV
jgi:hypothetical protein